MGDLIDFSEYKNKAKNRTIFNSIKAWIINLFHVHHWLDVEEVDVYDSNGIKISRVFIQKCTQCNLRSSQVFDYKGISKRKFSKD